MSSIKGEPTAQELQKIGHAIAVGDRIGATSMYISITECDLTEAQQFIKTLTTETTIGESGEVRTATKETSVLIWSG